MKTPVEKLQAAIDARIVDPQEVEDLIARARQRRKLATLDRVSKALDEGATEEEVLAALEKKK